MQINILDKGFIRLIDIMGTDKRIVDSARISYGGESKGEEQDKKLLMYLYKNKHMSPFEMCKVTLHIKMPIFVMRQYVRHRVQNLNEISFRYTEPTDDFYIPQIWRKQDTKNKQGSLSNDQLSTWVPEMSFMGDFACGHTEVSNLFEKACNELYASYQRLVASGVAREMARMILPVNLYTEIYATWDLRNLLHFIELRSDSHAQYEIREYSKGLEKIVEFLFPWTWEAYNKYKFILKDTTA